MKSKKKQEQKINYQFYTPPKTDEQKKFDLAAETAFNTPDPSIAWEAANLRENVDNRIDNPFGFNYSPEVAEAIKTADYGNIDQGAGQAYRQDANQRKLGKLGALESSARSAAPIFASSGGTMMETSSPGAMGLITTGIGAGADIGSALIT